MENAIQIFEETVLKFPNKSAVEDANETLSFLQLKKYAMCLAVKIRQYGFHEQPIGIIVDRTVWSTVMILGSLYSGNYYVPLDIFSPTEKFKYIIGNVQLKLIIAHNEERINIAVEKGYNGAVEVCDRESLDVERCVEISCYPSTILNVIYTSGSTGTPKGVVKSQKAMVDFIDNFCTVFHLNEELVIGNQTPFFFDAAAKDIFLMMASGATLVMIPSELFSIPIRLVTYMNERKISYICWVPSALSLVAQFNTFSEIIPKYLKKVFFVGEAFNIKQLRKWKNALPDIEYVNLYGATEVAGICCYYRLDDSVFENDELPIGRSLPGCCVYLLEHKSEGCITKPGMTGEICIAGSTIADGYYADDKKTAEKFVYYDSLGEKVYRTGDLGHYDNDGNIIYVGREDHQIKHMGYRIELGEIEAICLKQKEIQNCCCLYDKQKDRISLVVVLNGQNEIGEPELKRTMKEILPVYMIPQKLYIWDELPFNANGKLDRPEIQKKIIG